MASQNEVEIKKIADNQENSKNVLNSINISEIKEKIKTLDDENEDLRIRSMRYTLIFRGVRETEMTHWMKLVDFLLILTKKLQLDHYECNICTENTFHS